MTNEEFIKTVAYMRDCQKRFFETKDRAMLKRAKQLEWEVDNFLQKRAAEQLREIDRTKTELQKTLFNE